MTTSAQVTWRGKEFMEALRSGEDEAMFEAAQIILEAAAQRAPRWSGRLQRSGYVSTMSKSNYIRRRWHKRERKPTKPFSVVIAFSAPHSHLVEFGTVNMAAQPYLRPALDEVKNRFGQDVAVNLTKSLSKKLGSK